MSRALALVDSSGAPRTLDVAGASSPLLETKLYVPRARTGLVPRPRLVDAIRQGAARKLTIVVAPAGFGKTTLLAGWLAESAGAGSAVGWVSLDPTDNEPRLFLSYVIRALQKADPALGAHAISLLRSPSPPPVESVLTALVNEIDAADRDFTLVLDDYHVIDAAPVHGAMTFLLDHLPPRLRLVIASRADPPLALARLRARGELTELRVADMRFTPGEASAFLNEVMSLGLSASDAATLERRTEGWIAGLKLAAISMQGRRDVRDFVEGFSGDNRHVADYLVEEVLQAEPERVRRFLLGTAMLDRLSAPLCDAVTGGRDSAALLEELERRNLFVVALDDRREWYRYHHLFADVLQRQAARTEPDRARELHRRASDWYAEHGSPSDAVRHALSAADMERAAGLLEQTWPEKDRSYESRTWLDRAKSLPDELVRRRPVLAMGFAWGLINSGELEAAEPWLRDVERWLEPAAEGEEPIVGDAERFRTLPAELAAARVYLAQAKGEAPTTVEHAKRVLELTPEDDLSGRATGTALLALAHWGRGELEPAYRTFSDALALMRQGGNTLAVIRGTFVLGDIRVVQGRLRDARTIYEQGLRHAAEHVHASAPETDELHLGLSELHREWNDLASAVRHLDAISESPERAAHAGHRLRWCTAMAAVRGAHGDLDEALSLLEEGERNERRDPIPRARPIAALRARIRVLQGRLDDAGDWVRTARLSPNDEISYLREFEHMTLARVLIARSARDAVGLLERLRTAAQTGGRFGSVVEIMVLQALAQQTLGNLRGALDPLAEALVLAEPEGRLRVFMDEGTRMRDLLRQATQRGLAGEYTRRVLLAFDAPAPAVAPPTPAAAAGPVDALTARELEILRLIAAGLRNGEIADQLSISAATVKRHVANAYGKLGVGHRTEALARAAEMKLL